MAKTMTTTTAEDGGDKSGKQKSRDEEDKLLKAASSQRMNTAARRSVFCFPCPKAERDAIRVLVHCCKEEKAHLAVRVCEHQPQSKFTMTLSFWDTFKQLETYPPRKAANLAKLLAHLVDAKGCLGIGVMKRC